MIRNARETDEAPWIALAEVRRPVVVDLVHRLDQLAVLHAQADPQDPIHHLGVDAVEVLVLQAQVRRGRVRATLVEPDLEHLFHVLREAALQRSKPNPRPPKTPSSFSSAYQRGPSGVWRTCGTWSRNLAGAFLTQRSPGIQVMSMWQSAEMMR